MCGENPSFCRVIGPIHGQLKRQKRICPRFTPVKNESSCQRMSRSFIRFRYDIFCEKKTFEKENMTRVHKRKNIIHHLNAGTETTAFL